MTRYLTDGSVIGIYCDGCKGVIKYNERYYMDEKHTKHAHARCIEREREEVRRILEQGNNI